MHYVHTRFHETWVEDAFGRIYCIATIPTTQLPTDAEMFAICPDTEVTRTCAIQSLKPMPTFTKNTYNTPRKSR